MPQQSAVQQLLSKAAAFYHAGDYQQAVQVWNEILNLDPSNQRAKEGIRMASLLLEEAGRVGRLEDFGQVPHPGVRGFRQLQPARDGGLAC